MKTIANDDSSPLTSPVNEDKATANPVTEEGAQVTKEPGGVAGDGVVNPVIVVGEPEIAQATGDAACVRAGDEGGV